MPDRPVELVLVLLYLLVGPVTWVLYALSMFAGRKQMVLLRRPAGDLPANPPTVTVLIPAKDEGERIRACLLSAARQDYPGVDVIAINDRSIDNTGALMDELAASNPKLKVLHVKDPPGLGWTGKNNALHQGTKHAKGDWLLFVDSDVILEPEALRTAMAVALRKRFDLLSLLPRLEAQSIWESTFIPLCAGAASMMYLISLSNTNRMKTAFANGQFILMSRKAYDAIGGHVTVKDRYCEDIAIARLVKDLGMRPRISTGDEFCSVRMYSSVPAIIRGWSRIYYAAQIDNPWRIQLAITFLFVCCYSMIPAAVWGLYRWTHPGVGNVGLTAAAHVGVLWLALASGHFTMLTAVLAVIYKWSRNPPSRALLFLPVGGPMLLWILGRALKMRVTKKVEWRGTAYSHTMATNISSSSQG